MMDISPTRFQLVPLRIPTGWVTLFNNFTDEIPIIEKGVFINADHFSEDILRLQQYKPSRKNIQFAIDLGWYPPENQSGSFRLILVDINNDKLEYFRVIKVKHYQEVQQAINEWLDRLARYPFDYEAIEHLRGERWYPPEQFENVEFGFGADLYNLIVTQLKTGKYNSRQDMHESDWLFRAFNSVSPQIQPQLLKEFHLALVDDDPIVRSGILHVFEKHPELIDRQKFLEIISNHLDMLQESKFILKQILANLDPN